MNFGWGYGTEQRLRDENQDAHGVFEINDGVLAVVCDGMGGHAGGAQASSMAIRIIHDKLLELVGVEPRDALVSAITDANRQIYDTSRRSHRLMGMGTTVVAAYVSDGAIHVAHVGDSRAYLVRGDQAQQLTRDHTMVNLFVEAELLSPEDAASHPEAHVLARSLGVERTVDVELQDPLTVHEGDAFILCSDGVHGLLTEWEFGRVNWEDPQQGVRKVLQMVNDREGDDNASVVSLGFGGRARSELPATPPPEVGGIGDTISSSTSGAQPAPPPIAPLTPKPPTSASAKPPDSLGELGPPPAAEPDVEVPFVDLEALDPEPLIREPVRFEDPVPPPPKAEPPDASGLVSFAPEPAPPQDGSLLDAKPAGPSMLRLGLVATGAALTVFLFAAVVVLVYRFVGPGDDEPVVDAPMEVTGEPGEEVRSEWGLEEIPLAPDAPVIEGAWSFAPQLPPPSRLNPWRPITYTQRPPPGTVMLGILDKAQGASCAESLVAMGKAMEQTSRDYAQLYNNVWYCFSSTHSTRLRQVGQGQHGRVTSVLDFVNLLPYFQGEVVQPHWATPAAEGIEYRLEAWERSTDADLFVEVMLDLHGPNRIADDLGRDLLVEAQAAKSLSLLPPEMRTPQSDMMWARRVYITRKSLKGSVGALVKAHLLDLYKTIDATLIGAVPEPGGPEVAPEGEPPPAHDNVPAVVREALAAAMSDEETAAPVTAEPTGPTEPVVVAPPPPDDPEPWVPKVHRPPNNPQTPELDDP